jgi:ribosomal protein S10
MFLHFKVSSKDSQTLKMFFRFLQKLKSSSTVLKYFSKQNKRKFITVLKSPHVNKTAQEQFEFRYYSKEFLVNSLKPLTFFLAIKKIQNLSFPGLKLEVKGFVNPNQKSKSFLKLIDPDNVVLAYNSSKFFNHLLLPSKYVQLFDCYGELRLKELLVSKASSV